MALNRFVIAFIGALPCLAMAAPATMQDANQLFRQGKYVQALDKVDSFLVANPKDAQGRFLKGLILTELNRIPESIKVFNDLTDDYPELPEPYNNLAVLYASQGLYDRAKNSLEMAIRTHPSYATAHENLGDIYAKMASLAYDKALQLDQANRSAQTKLSLIKDLFSSTPSMASAKAKPVKTASAAPASAAKAPEASKPAATAAPVDADAKAAVERAVDTWAKAWSDQDVDGYLAAYADTYAQPGMDRAAWMALRRDRLTKPANIVVEIQDLEISVAKDKATATFKQRYQSDRYQDMTRKTLSLERQGDNWKIVGER